MSEFNYLTRQLNTKSWCHSNVIVKNFSFVWTIDNFAHCQEETGWFIRSSPFPSVSYEELEWCVRIYPRGDLVGNKEYVSIYLELASSNKFNVPATFKFSILNTRQEEKQVLMAPVPRRFIQGATYGFGKYILRSFLFDKANALFLDGRLTLCCEVTVLVGCKTAARNRAAMQSPDPESQLSDDLGRLLSSQRLSDVILVSDNGQEFAAHKAILAGRSPVFAAMFEHDMKEKGQNRVEISDMEPRVLEAVLRYIYTGKASDITTMPEELLAAAERYALEGLKVMCEEIISSNLSIGRAAEVLVLADLYRANVLKNNVVGYIHTALADVMATTGWHFLIQTHPHLIPDVFKYAENHKLPF